MLGLKSTRPRGNNTGSVFASSPVFRRATPDGADSLGSRVLLRVLPRATAELGEGPPLGGGQVEGEGEGDEGLELGRPEGARPVLERGDQLDPAPQPEEGPLLPGSDTIPCQVVKSPSRQVAKSPNRQIAKSSSHQDV